MGYSAPGYHATLKIQFLIHKKINFKILIAVNVNNKMKIELA